MRAAGCDEALYDYKNRIAKAVEMHRKITALDENCSYVCEMTLPETRAEMFELINPYSVLTSSLITGTSRGATVVIRTSGTAGLAGADLPEEAVKFRTSIGAHKLKDRKFIP